jgi:hypothetical protein
LSVLDTGLDAPGGSVYNTGMSKTGLICFRADPEFKRRIVLAARGKGQTITSFLREVILRAVTKAESRQPVKRQSRGACPAYFRACCEQASRGGTLGYGRAGYELARHLGSVGPYELEADDWQAELNRLGELLRPTGAPVGSGDIHRIADEDVDNDAVLGWFDEHCPRCMELVPRRRRAQFLEGVFKAMEDDEIELVR